MEDIKLNYCRICLTDKTLEFVLLDETYPICSNRQKSLWHFYCTVTGLSSTKKDIYSRKICKKCSIDLVFAYNFQQQARSNFEKLKTRPIVKEEYLEEFHDSPCPPSSPFAFEEEEKHDVSNVKSEDEVSIPAPLLMEQLLILQENENTVPKHRGELKKKYYYNSKVRVCPGCQEEFPSKQTFLKHFRERNKDQLDHQYFCSECGKYFRKRNSIRVHMMQHKKEGNRIKCDQCEKTYTQLGVLSMHKKLCHSAPEDIPAYTCSHCHKTYKKKSLLQRHIRSVHEQRRPIACTMCEKRFVDRTDMKAHFKRMHSGRKIERPFKCTLCPKTYTGRVGLQFHIENTHSTEEKYHCTLCPSKFKCVNNLNQHLKKTHKLGSYAYFCDHCGGGYYSKVEFTDHLASKHGEGGPLHRCNECGKEFLLISALRSHMKFHNNTTFDCELCGKKFPTKTGLRKHGQTHGLLVRDKICTHHGCGKAFYQQNCLNRHVREVHLGLRKSKIIKEET